MGLFQRVQFGRRRRFVRAGHVGKRESHRPQLVIGNAPLATGHGQQAQKTKNKDSPKTHVSSTSEVEFTPCIILELQDRHDPARFGNIWIRPLDGHDKARSRL